jgi:uncharacterized protein (TIGR02300 family)
MSQKALRGTKRICGSCDNAFYDLGRDPIICPHCKAVFLIDKATEAPAIALDTVKASKTVKPPVKIKELVGEEAAPGEAGEVPEMESTEVLAEIEAEDTDIEGAEAEDTFLEEEEGEDTDVSGLIDNPVEGEEET